MSTTRIAALLVTLATTAIGYHFHGAAMWIVFGAGFAIGAALALYALYEDGALRDVMVPKGLDISSGVVAAAILYLVIVIAWFNLVAPANVLGGVLRKCNLEGPRVPRLDTHGVALVYEWLRTQACRGYGRSLGVVGPTRGLLIVVIAALEEIAWRGGVQQYLSEKVGSTRGWVAASVLNGAAYLPGGNVPLALLALVAAFVWGGLYRYRQRLVPSIASHIVFSYFLFYARPLVDFT